jgi:hypothetical protein
MLLLASPCLSVCPHVSTREIWTNFHKILYWGVLLHFVKTFRFWLNSEKNNWHFTQGPVRRNVNGEFPGHSQSLNITFWSTYQICYAVHKSKSEAVPIRTTQALRGAGSIAPTNSWVVIVALWPHFTSGEKTPVAIGSDAGWASELVWTQRLQERSFVSAWEQTPVVQSVVGHYTGWGTPPLNDLHAYPNFFFSWPHPNRLSWSVHLLHSGYLEILRHEWTVRSVALTSDANTAWSFTSDLPHVLWCVAETQRRLGEILGSRSDEYDDYYLRDVATCSLKN